MATRLARLRLHATGALYAALLVLPLPSSAGQTVMRALIHIPTKSLTSMPLFFGKDKGFFAREGVDVDLV
ncbi:MAG TPA: hypothetical protein VGH22_16925, partial [Candidatus Binatia bacterium]